MRACTGENVKVFEAKGDTLSELLAELALEVPKLEAPGSYINPSIYHDTETNQYVVTLYVH